MSNCIVKIVDHGGPGLFIKNEEICTWGDRVLHTVKKGYGYRDHYIAQSVVEHMCNDAYKQGMRDATSKLERIQRIIEE